MGLREYAAQKAPEETTAPEAQEPEQPQSNPLFREQQRQRENAEQAATVYEAHQAAIKKVSSTEAAILKGLAAGENIAALFLKAVEGLSLLTGNRLLYEQAAADIGTIYGYALQDPAAAELEAENVRERLKRLEAAAEANPGSAENIARAIRAHRAQLERLTGAGE